MRWSFWSKYAVITSQTLTSTAYLSLPFHYVCVREPYIAKGMHIALLVVCVGLHTSVCLPRQIILRQSRRIAYYVFVFTIKNTRDKGNLKLDHT